MGFFRYFGICFVLTGGSAALSVSLWSRLGCGWQCFDFALTHFELCRGSIGFILLAALALYLLDFFAPPHLPGRYLHFGDGCEAAGHAALTAIAVACFAACVFSAHLIPSLPLLATTFLSPVCVILVHQALISEDSVESLSLEELASMDFEDRISLLRNVNTREREQRDFCAAAMSALAVVGLSCILIWVPWGLSNDIEQDSGHIEPAMLFVIWAAPLVVGLSNLVFAAFVSLRVMLNHRYKMTHSFKNRLIVSNALHSTREEVQRYRDVILQARNSFVKGMTVTMTPTQVDKYLTQHISCMWLLSLIMKAIGCAFIVMISAMFVTFQLVTAVGRTTSVMVQSFSFAFFLTFVSFVAVCFGRLWQAMHHWLIDFPLWQSLLGVTETAWARAAFALLALPLCPFVLALSALNQCIRQWRGILLEPEETAKSHSRQRPAPSEGGDPSDTPESPKEAVRTWHRPILTERLQRLLLQLTEWEWAPIIWWWYVLAWVLIIIKLTPLLLNVLLAEMNSILSALPFGVILLATFGLGMVLFMLPPVPGPPIYLFGGVVISDACPWGFWWGSVICVTLSFLLKLTACAVQQKLIGERLGSSLSVRRAAGVHKPLIRAIEMVLRKPGLSFDKCMILCGGPDWPTSVLAGILQLSLVQCLIGTIPVLASVIPLCLTGSFYLKRSEGQLWVRAGNLMFTLTAVISAGFWAGMGWAIQDVYDKFQNELTEPREEYLELEWLDYREEFISDKLRLQWIEIPAWVRCPYIAGALCVTLVCHAVLWRSTVCFGSFSVTGDTSELKWLGNDGLVRPLGQIALAVLLISTSGLVLFSVWDRQRKSPLRPVAAQEIDILEELWKEQKVQQARDAANALAWEKACADEVIKRVSAVAPSTPSGSENPETWSVPSPSSTVWRTVLQAQSLGRSSARSSAAQTVGRSTSTLSAVSLDQSPLPPVRRPSAPKQLDTE